MDHNLYYIRNTFLKKEKFVFIKNKLILLSHPYIPYLDFLTDALNLSLIERIQFYFIEKKGF